MILRSDGRTDKRIEDQAQFSTREDTCKNQLQDIEWSKMAMENKTCLTKPLDNLSAVLMDKGDLRLLQKPIPTPDKDQVLIQMRKVRRWDR